MEDAEICRNNKVEVCVDDRSLELKTDAQVLENILKHWDPMNDHYSSFQNIPSLNPDDVDAFFTGQNSSKENLCKFYDGISEGCFKGGNCKALHIKGAGPKLAEEFPKLAVRTDKERVGSSRNLDERKVAPPASIFKAVVSCADTPSNFFLVPEYEFKCACSGICSPEVHHNKVISQGMYSGITSYNTVTKELNVTIGKATATNRFSNTYDETELVAFDANSVKQTGRPFWLRGVVSSAVYVEESGEKCPSVKLFLFDTGHRVETTTRHVCQLPKIFRRIPPFSFRCSLYGVRPKDRVNRRVVNSGKKQAEWSVEAIRDFQKLIKSPRDLMETKQLSTENLVLVEIKKSVCTDSSGVYQRNPYSVMITCRDQQGRAINVSEEMVKLGHAEFINFDKNSEVSFSAWELLQPLSSLP